MKKEIFEAQQAERMAAHKLLVDYIGAHANDIAMCIENIIPFFQECSMHGLQSAMNTVNVTFASVALNVIRSIGESTDEDDRLFLPVDADDMKDAIYYLSRIIELLGPLSSLCGSDDPAIKMCKSAFCHCENC